MDLSPEAEKVFRAFVIWNDRREAVETELEEAGLIHFPESGGPMREMELTGKGCEYGKDDKRVNAVKDNPELLVKEFLKDYYSPAVLISQETAAELRDILIEACKKKLGRCECGGDIIIKAEQAGGPDDIHLFVMDINAKDD